MIKYILGGGIAGLIWGFYNRDYQIISPEIGGQFNTPFTLGPRYLEATSFSKRFLQDVGLQVEEKTIKIGCYNGQFIEPDENFKQQYFEKSRGQSGSDETCMNCSKKELKIYDVDFTKLVLKLKQQLLVNIISNSITNIDIAHRCLVLSGTSKQFDFDKLISTIPLNKFMQLIRTRKKMQFQAMDITYVLLDNNYFDMKQFDFVYVLGQKFHRITKTSNGLVADWLGEHTQEECQAEFGQHFRNSLVLKNAQIISMNKIPTYKDVIFSGRYGQWNRKYKIEQVIEDAIKFKELNKNG